MKKVIALLILLVLLVIFGPLSIVWALNTLFALGIAYTWKTWLAILLLSAAFGNTRVNFNGKS
jgi:hypothetical protein